MTPRCVPCPFPLLAALATLAACAGEDPKVVRAAADRRGVETVAQAVRTTPRDPATGRWNQATLTQRLINAGLAPRPDDSLPSHPDYGVTPVAYRLGRAHLLVWIYGDSIKRRAVSLGIDTLTAIPKGQPSPWAEPPMFVTQNNLIAVVVGGTDRQRERVRLTLEAGLAPPRP